MTNPDPKLMFEHARLAFEHAYAPYSQFKVGCCIYTSDTGYHQGCNVENAAYPMSCCAEAGAIADMVVKGGKKISAVLVLADLEEGGIPCGGCLQKLSEFADADTMLYSANLHKVTQVQKLSALFNGKFTLAFNRLHQH